MQEFCNCGSLLEALDRGMLQLAQGGPDLPRMLLAAQQIAGKPGSCLKGGQGEVGWQRRSPGFCIYSIMSFNVGQGSTCARESCCMSCASSQGHFFCIAVCPALAGACAYLHSHNVIHGDLTPSNVLLTSTTKDAKSWLCKVGQQKAEVAG